MTPEPIPTVYAYLDPGTGSLLVSVLVGVAASIWFTARSAVDAAAAHVLGWFGRTPESRRSVAPLVLFSEGGHYASTFVPLMNVLDARRIRYTYLTVDANDPVLVDTDRRVGDRRCIGRGAACWAFMRHLDARVCVTTTPGLDVLAFKRSRRTARYVHVVHAPTDKAFNKPFSFDHFDAVVTSGPHQVRTLRALESARGRRSKRLPIAGCLYYDEMVRRTAASATISQEAPLTVLVAPTWGPNGLLSRFGASVPERLLEHGFRVLLRPHPQSRISEPELLERLESQLGYHDRLLWDHSDDPVPSMARSDAMVSDISGVVFDFAFLFERPVVTIRFDPVRSGFDAMDVPHEPWELTVLDAVGCQIDADAIGCLPSEIERLAGDDAVTRRVRALRSEAVVNFGHAAAFVIDEIEREIELAEEARGV